MRGASDEESSEPLLGSGMLRFCLAMRLSWILAWRSDAGPRLHHGIGHPIRRALLRCRHERARLVKVGRREDWLGYGERPGLPILIASIFRSARAKAGRRLWPSLVFQGALAEPGRRVLGRRHRRRRYRRRPAGARYHAAYYAAFLRDPDGNRYRVCPVSVISITLDLWANHPGPREFLSSPSRKSISVFPKRKLSYTFHIPPHPEGRCATSSTRAGDAVDAHGAPDEGA